MEKVIITKVYKSDAAKDGTKFISKKNGKPFWKVAIQTDKFGDTWFSTFAFDQNDEEYLLKEGDERTIVVTESNGFKNFKLPTRLDYLEQKISDLEFMIHRHIDGVAQPKPAVQEVKEEEINPEDIPF